MSNAASPGAPNAAPALGWRRDAPPGNYATNHGDGTLELDQRAQLQESSLQRTRWEAQSRSERSELRQHDARVQHVKHVEARLNLETPQLQRPFQVDIQLVPALQVLRARRDQVHGHRRRATSWE